MLLLVAIDVAWLVARLHRTTVIVRVLADLIATLVARLVPAGVAAAMVLLLPLGLIGCGRLMWLLVGHESSPGSISLVVVVAAVQQQSFPLVPATEFGEKISAGAS